MTLWIKGPVVYRFQDEHELLVYYPQLVQGGIIFGNRLLKFTKRVCAIDFKYNLKGYAAFGKKIEKGPFKSTRADTVTGEIFTFDPRKHKPLSKDLKNLYDQFKGKDKIESKSKCEGIVQESIQWDQVEYFSFDQTRAMRHTPVDHPIPSDCRYREDIVWVKREDKV